MRALGTLVATSDVANGRSPAYDIVLLAHVLSALVGFGAVVVAGGYALALRHAGPGGEAVRRYYRPGINWGGRVLFLVPVLGVALIAMSHGRWGYSDGWVGLGLVLWAAAATVAEMALWPTERRLQQLVAALPTGARSPEPGTPEPPGPTQEAELQALCLRAVLLAALLFVVAVVATVVMVAKP
jgi:hypothetical protein